LENKDYNSI